MINYVIKELEGINWNDFEEVELKTRNVLEIVKKNPAIIRTMLKNALNNDDLISLVEHYDFFDKIILYIDKKDRFRIRIHLFSEDSSNVYRPHCHRWVYSTLILKGKYEHNIYGTENMISKISDITKLTPILKRVEKRGSIYTLDHTVFHSIKAEPGTASFLIRGPGVKDRFLIVDKKTGKKWWEYGRDSETVEEIEKKSVNATYLEKLIKRINKLDIF